MAADRDLAHLRNVAAFNLLASYPDVPRCRAARDAARELARYAASGWLREACLPQLPETSSARRKSMHRLLMLSGGVAVEWRQLLRLAVSIDMTTTCLDL
jgi:hypothetical protein